jgi:phosphoglycolate phosphatase
MQSIIFDLDGTLVHTAPDLVETLNVVLRSEGLPPVPYEDALVMIGDGAKRLLEHGLSSQKVDISPALLEKLYQDFLAYYADHIADLSRPFPGLEDALDKLAADGWLLAVCTNKLEYLSMRLLDALNLTHRFKVVCGADTYGIAKPNPEVLRRTIAAAGGDPARAIMVGDSITDIATAKAAGVPVIAVDFGYTNTPVSQLGPDRIISHYEALAGAVAALSNRA